MGSVRTELSIMVQKLFRGRSTKMINISSHGKDNEIGKGSALFHLVLQLMLFFVTTASAQTPATASLLQSFRDCPYCPEMVVLPAGSFLMGESKESFINAGIPTNLLDFPQHNVSVRTFAIAKYDVTKGEFAKFVQETGYNPSGCKIYEYQSGIFHITGWVDSSRASWHYPGFDQTDQHPVVCVSWDDAQHYVSWLNGKLMSQSSKLKAAQYHYRLPSEAEWEYAARAGTRTLRYWGDNAADQCDFANGRDLTLKERYPDWLGVATCKDGFAATSPVGSFPPNKWGLYDMLGNVDQWAEDCWNFDHSGAPSDGQARISGDCTQRVIRGAAWATSPEFLISATRISYPSSSRDSAVGFRLARDVH